MGGKGRGEGEETRKGETNKGMKKRKSKRGHGGRTEKRGGKERKEEMLCSKKKGR